MWNRVLIKKCSTHYSFLCSLQNQLSISSFGLRCYSSKYQGKLKEMMEESKGKSDNLTISSKKFAKQDLKKILDQKRLDPTQDNFEKESTPSQGTFGKIKQFFSKMRETTTEKILSIKI